MIEPRTYDPKAVIAFRKTDGPFGGLSNMAPGYPLRVAHVDIRTSEALYQACRFPHKPDIQRIILAEASPMTAKMRSKPYRPESRPDWDAVRIPVMKWCLRVKLVQNATPFGDLLRRTCGKDIVEDSRKDEFWGARLGDDGLLHGRNVLGRLLMELREKLVSDPTGMTAVSPVPIERFDLLGSPIEEVIADSSAAWYTLPEEQRGDRRISVTVAR